MDYIIPKSKFISRALEYLQQVEKTGEELIITEQDKPVLKITPYAENPQKVLNSFRNTVLKYDNPTDPVGLNDWEVLKS